GPPCRARRRVRCHGASILGGLDDMNRETAWPPETRQRVAAAIIDAALPTENSFYRFQVRDGTWTSSSEPPAEGEPHIDLCHPAVTALLAERLLPALALLKTIYGIDDESAAESPPPDELRTPATAVPMKYSVQKINELVKSIRLGEPPQEGVREKHY